MMQFSCECLTLCNCLQYFIDSLTQYSKGSREWIISREKNRNEDKIKTYEFLPHNQIGLHQYNYTRKNGLTLDQKPKGRPVGTHNTVIGRNKIDLKRYDYARYTRNSP